MSQLNVSTSCGSGWAIESLNCVEVIIATCQNLNGSSHIGTPIILKGVSTSILNVRKGKDNIRYLTENVKRLKFNGKGMPMRLFSVAPVEKVNIVPIHVYQVDNRKLEAVYDIRNKTSKQHIKILRLVDGSRSHYRVTKNFSKLLQRITRLEKNEDRVPSQNSAQTAFNP